jgi:phosphoribosylformimino-5-aminoimidazole carboxamide ribotide isomerase
MILYPAIDVLDGRVVRLEQGKFTNVTDYGDDPVAVVARFKALGAKWVHVVDLSGARDKQPRQSRLITEMCSAGLSVQAGGGVRSDADLDRLLDAGCQRVIIGSLAVSEPKRVQAWMARVGTERICLAFDVRCVGGTHRLTTSGWTELSTLSLDELVEPFIAQGLQHALVTDIARDGMMAGPNLDLYADLVARFPSVNWQASGGVASLADLTALAGSGAAGVITGRALYEDRFDVAEALTCLQSA